MWQSVGHGPIRRIWRSAGTPLRTELSPVFERRRDKDGTVGAHFRSQLRFMMKQSHVKVNIFAYLRMFIGLDLVVHFNCYIFSAVSSTVVSRGTFKSIKF